MKKRLWYLKYAPPSFVVARLSQSPGLEVSLSHLAVWESWASGDVGAHDTQRRQDEEQYLKTHYFNIAFT